MHSKNKVVADSHMNGKRLYMEFSEHGKQLGLNGISANTLVEAMHSAT